jgi:Bacterial SH3 domain
MLTPDEFQHLQEIFGQLRKEEREKLLQILHSKQNVEMQQFNTDEAKSFQVEVNGGVAYVGDIHINSADLEDILRRLFAEQVQYSANDFHSSYYEDILEYPVENYANTYDWRNSDRSSGISFRPVLIAGAVAVCGLGAFFSGIGNKTAVVRTPPNLSAANVKDDSANIKESLSNGTVVHLTGKRDGNYCGTDHGWIYCPYLVENNLDKPVLPSPHSSPGGAVPSAKTAIVQPDSDKKAANLRAQPNAGQVIGQVLKGEKVQVIRCTEDGCEVRHGSMQGWIYKPYLRW